MAALSHVMPRLPTSMLSGYGPIATRYSLEPHTKRYGSLWIELTSTNATIRKARNPMAFSGGIR